MNNNKNSTILLLPSSMSANDKAILSLGGNQSIGQYTLYHKGYVNQESFYPGFTNKKVLTENIETLKKIQIDY